MHVAIYRGFPHAGATTGFTVGLSHFHPPEGGHKELTISMSDDSEAWALACGFLAFQLRNMCPFIAGDTINFRAGIAPSSAMSAFLISEPLHIVASDALLSVGDRRVEITGLVPLYEQERAWLMRGGDLDAFLGQYDVSQLMDPARTSFAGAS